MACVDFASPLDAALRMAAMGMSVIPLRPHDKAPAVAWTEFQTRRANETEIRGWFDRMPNANVGLVCGSVSGVSVIDIDGKEGEDWFKASGLPTPPVWQVTSGPHKRHLLYRHPGEGFMVHPSVDTSIKVDVRGDGSQIVLAPSIHPSGAVYSLHYADGMTFEDALAALPMMPGQFVSLPSDAIYTKPARQTSMPKVRAEQEGGIVEEGGRNAALTSQCGVWYHRGLDEAEVMILAHAWNAAHCQPEMPRKEVETIVHSMAKTHGGRNPDLLQTGGVWTWLEKAAGQFSVNDIYRDLSVTYASDKAKVRDQLMQAERLGVIDADKDRAGVWRKKDQTLEEINLDEDPGTPLNMWLPFGLDKTTNIFPGNTVVVAGETNSGKTALLLNIVACNPELKFRYLSSEMTPQELRGRLEPFGGRAAFTHCKFFQRSVNFADAIDPDAVNIIDYLEMSDNFFKANAYITQIFERLDKGIAIICVQKKRGELFGRGGEFTLEKARLGLSLFTHGHIPGGIVGSCLVTKCKNPKPGMNCDGKEVFYRLTNGGTFDSKPVEALEDRWQKGFHFYGWKERQKFTDAIQEWCKDTEEDLPDYEDYRMEYDGPEDEF